MQGKQGFCGGNFGPFLPSSSIFPEVVGEGDVIPVIHPDGSVQYYFQPKTKLLNQPFAHCCYANSFSNQNNDGGIWLVRSILNPEHNSLLQSSLPFGMQYPRPDGKLFGYNGFMKFHNDRWTSTTDLHYFYHNSHNSSPPCVMMSPPVVDTVTVNHMNPIPMETSHMDFRCFGQGEYRNGCTDFNSNVGCLSCKRSSMDVRYIPHQGCKCSSVEPKSGCNNFGCNSGNGEAGCPCSRAQCGPSNGENYIVGHGHITCSSGNDKCRREPQCPYCNHGNENKSCCSKELSKCSCGHPACGCSETHEVCRERSVCVECRPRSRAHGHVTYVRRRHRRKETKRVVFTCPSSTSASSYNPESGDNTELVVVTELPSKEKQSCDDKHPQ